MEKTSNKPSVIVISFINFGSDEYEVRGFVSLTQVNLLDVSRNLRIKYPTLVN